VTRPVAGGGAPGDTRRHAMGIRIPAPPCIFSIWIDPEAVNPERWFDESVRQIEAIASMARNNPRTIAMARTATEVRGNSERGLLSALLGVEGAHSLLPGTDEEQLSQVREEAGRRVAFLGSASAPITTAFPSSPKEWRT